MTTSGKKSEDIVPGSQLFKISSEDFRDFLHLDINGTIETKPSGCVPMMTWPNGRWCIEANLFLQSLLDRGYSHDGSKGGTLGTYAAYLAHILRFVFKAQISFPSFRDSHFRLFRSGLNVPVVRKGKNRPFYRNGTTIDKIISCTLDFLEFVGFYYNVENFVAKNGCIKAYKVPFRKKTSRHHYSTGEKWEYGGRQERRDINHRLPITENDLRLIKHAADNSRSKSFIRMRRLAMLNMLEMTGLRRRELTLMQVENILEAIEELEIADNAGDGEFIPIIRFKTVKDGPVRECPVNRVELKFLESYIEKFRAPLMRKLQPKLIKSGPLLVSETKGTRLTENTITLEFKQLAKEAKIDSTVSPHLVRHRYITQLFVRLILAHNIETEDELRKLLLNTKALKEKVREITGHADSDTLDLYIHVAIDEVAEFRKTLRKINDLRGLNGLSDARDRFYHAATTPNANVVEAVSELAASVDQLLKSFFPSAAIAEPIQWKALLQASAAPTVV